MPLQPVRRIAIQPGGENLAAAGVVMVDPVAFLGFVALASVKLWIPFVHET